MRGIRIAALAALTILISFGNAQIGSADPGCTSSETGVLGWYPKFQEDAAFGCTQEGLANRLIEGAARLGASAQVEIVINFTDSSPTIQEFVSGSASARTVFFKTHGNYNGAVLQYFATVAARDAALQTLQNQGWTDVYPTDGGPAPGIFIHGEAIEARIAPGLSSEVLIGAFHCYSGYARDYWGTFTYSNGGGPTYIGWENTCGADQNCDAIQHFISTLGCYDFPGTGHQVDDGARGVPGIFVYGNQKNQYNCDRSCWNWSVNFLEAGAWDGAVHFAVRGEDAETRYEVWEYASPTSEPSLVAEIYGQGSDGYGRVNAYSVPVSGGPYFQVIEYDGLNRKAPTRLLTWDQEPDGWQELAAFDGHSLEELLTTPEAVEGPLMEWKAGELILPSESRGSNLLPPEDENCADVVIYSSRSYYVAPVLFHVDDYQTEQGYPIKARTFVGSSNPLDARAALQGVIAANLEYNDSNPGGRRYPSDPILYIVGDRPDVNYLTFADDEYESCIQPSCKSYALIYDLNGDQRPDGPVGVIPARDIYEVERLCAATDDWNANRFVDANGTGLIMGGDVAGGTAPWMEEELSFVRAAYLSSGMGVQPLLLESDFPDYTSRRQAGYAAINSGARDIWAQGLSTTVDDLTQFIAGSGFDGAQLTTKQRVMIFAPTCESLALWWPEDWSAHVFRELLFNDLERTVAVGFVGQLNGAYGDPHRWFRDVLLNEISNAQGERVPMPRIVQRAVETVQEQFPNYGNGVVYFGAHALTPGDLTTVSVPDAPASSGAVAFWAAPVTKQSTKLHFTLPSQSRVSLNVYDVSGRLVAPIKHETLAAGTHTYQWFHHTSASGVYFARLDVDDRAYKTKVLVLR